MEIVIAMLVLIIVAVFLPEMVTAQPVFPEEPPQVPIDGGLTLLAAGGAAYALKKLRSRKK